MPSKEFLAAREAEKQAALKTIFNSTIYTVDQAKQIVRVLKSGIDDQEWEQIKKSSSLPTDARARIDRIIHAYVAAKLSDVRADYIEADVQNLRRLIKELLESIKRLAHDEEFYKGFYPFYGSSPTDQRIALDAGWKNLQRLDGVLIDAERRFRFPLSQSSFGPLFLLMRLLDALMLEYGGGCVSLSKKNPGGINFVIAVAGVAEPGLAEGTVVAVLKQYSRQRKKWGPDILHMTQP